MRASINENKTVLTEITHQAPARLHPISTADTSKAGSAWCMLGEYGGGLLGGDTAAIDVNVDHNATLTLSTQGATKAMLLKMITQPNPGICR